MGYAYGYLLSEEISKAYFSLLRSLLGGGNLLNEVRLTSYSYSYFYLLCTGCDGSVGYGFGLAMEELSGRLHDLGAKAAN